MSFLFAMLFLIGCNSKEKIVVKYAGALKTIMHEGDISSKINLNQFASTEHLFALGAVKNLKGEIIILDSDPFVSEIRDSTLYIKRTFNVGATLFVYSQVENWKEFSIPDEIIDLVSFESFIVNTAKENNIDIESPFPFSIEGKVKYAKWHVIDWIEGDTVHSHEKHKNSGLHGTIEDTEVTILGFYSTNHKGIFTHMSSNMHMHLINKDETVAGHVDQVVLRENKLYLPAG